jgi:O-antigen ligase
MLQRLIIGAMEEARRVSLAGMLFVPAGLVLYFAFNSGGFYPGAPAYIAMLLCVALAGRMLLARAPLAGRSRLLWLAAGSLGAYTLLTLLSGTWSHASGVARVEFDLPLVYLLAMIMFGLIGRTRTRLRWILRGLAVAALIVCGAGLITRVLPHVWPISPSIASNRLSFPVTYWNVEGLVAALGLVLCLHLTSDLREPVLSRMLAAGAIPILASALLFTFSRGAIGTCGIVVVVYALLGRPRGLLTAVIAIGPATAIAVKVAYDANLLATLNPTTPSAVIQGHHVATVVGVCAAGALVLRAALAIVVDARLRRFSLPISVRRPPAWMGWAALAAVAVVLAVAFRHTISREYHGFTRPPQVVGSSTDLRARLTDPSNNGRIDNWKVAWRGFKSAPAVGHGAGSYLDEWARYRPNSDIVLDAHSLYLETLDELGVVGLLLLVIPLLTILARAASRIRGSGRALYAAVFALLLGWAIHAGVDWDWEMPVVTVIFFSLGGFVVGRRLRPASPQSAEPESDGAEEVAERQRIRTRVSATRQVRRGLKAPTFLRRIRPRSGHRPEPPGAKPTIGVAWRVALALPFLALALLPAFTWVSQQKLDTAFYAFAQGDCAAAQSAALSSISVLGNRADPYEILGYCDVRMGRARAGVTAMQTAVSLDPDDWNYRYDLAVMQAAAGLDPLQAARQALAMNPHEPLIQEEWRLFRTGSPRQWVQDAQNIVYSFNVL